MGWWLWVWGQLASPQLLAETQLLATLEAPRAGVKHEDMLCAHRFQWETTAAAATLQRQKVFLSHL